MKVAWFHSHIQNWSGGTKFLHETLKRLAKVLRITFYVEAADPAIQRMFEGDGIPVVVFTGTKSSKSKGYWIGFDWQAAQEVRWVKQNVQGFDLYVSSMFPMNYVLDQAGKRPHACFCFEPFAFFHDREMIEGHGMIPRNALRILSRLHAPKDVSATQAADEILTLNRDVARWIQRTYGRASVPTYLGVDTDMFQRIEPNPLREKYASRRVIIHSTDYTPLKRTWFLVHSMKALARKMPEVLLVITHSQDNPHERGKMDAYIRRENLQKHVHILGLVDYQDLPKYYSLAEVAIYPGVGYGTSACSYFVLECMACETPCVRSNTTTEEVVDNESGYLFDPQNAPEMENKIFTLLANPVRLRQMGQRARQTILQKYAWDSVLRVFLSSFKKLTGSPCPR